MKDKIITKVIPKTHKYIVLFLAFTFLVGFFTFIALLEGFKIDRLTFNGVIIEKLYLKWDNSLLISASKIDLTNLQKDNLPLTLQPLGKLPPLIRGIERWVTSIDINTIKYKKVTAALHYRKMSPGIVRLYEGNMTCDGNFNLDERSFRLTFPACSVSGASFAGNLSIILPTQKLNANFFLTLPQTPTLHITASGDTNTLRFHANASDNFTSIKELVNFFDIDPTVKPWISEYAKASSLHLHQLDGKFHYNKPEELLETLYAKATVSEGKYTFAQGFEPIKSPQVDLTFQHGKLYIKPIQGTFYSLPTEQSTLFIDFSKKHTTLFAQIKTAHGMLNDPILALLHFYKIDLPIKQTTGTCDVDLNLTVDLHTLDTIAKGTFRPSKSELLLDQIPLRSEGGIVTLNNTHVTFENFIAHYAENVAHARVNGAYDASSGRGMVAIDAYDVNPLNNQKHLKLSDPLRVTYLIAPNGDSLSVASSRWNVFGETLRIEAFRTPFDYHNARSTLKSVSFNLNNTIHGTIDALFDGAKKQTDVKIHFSDFKLAEVRLTAPPLTINVHYDQNNAFLSSTGASAWSFHQLPLLISPFRASMSGDEITFEHIEAVLGDMLKGKFTGTYHLNTQKGSILLSDMLPLSPKISPIIDAQKSLNLTIDASKDQIVLDAQALKSQFTTIKNGWKIALSDISLLSQKSPLLRRYHIDNGYLNLYYSPESSRYNFSGSIIYPYPMMMVDEKPLSRYNFSGSYLNGATSIRINDRLLLTRNGDIIDVTAKNAGINMPQLFHFLSDHAPASTVKPSSAENSLFVRIHALNTYLYLMKGRSIVADTMEATLTDDDMDASLNHMGGSATLKIRNGLFYIDGNGFNDKFMEHLFRFSDFSGGTFSFQAKGESDSFDGIMRVENTILKDYKALNNVLAFVNTVPSLATFSLPNYNIQGLPLKEGYAHFTYDQGIVRVDNFTLNSPEVKILGEGRADLQSQTLEGALTLKTDLGSKLGKVPMVGYILFGDDGSVSTTLTLSGKLDNPKVETAIAKEIVTAPFNILKRTLVYPFLWMIPDEKKKK
jgi:hypothetical protein